MRSAQTRRANLFEQGLQLSSGPAVSVHDDQLFVTRPQVVELHAQLVDDPRRIEVEQRRHAVDVDVPSAPIHYVFDLFTEGAAHDERSSVHPTSSKCGKPSTDTNASLKSV